MSLNQPITLAVDLDVLLCSCAASESSPDSSGALATRATRLGLTEPSFTFAVRARARQQPQQEQQVACPTPSDGSDAHSPQPAGTNPSALTTSAAPDATTTQECQAWLRPGVRRFLVSVQPHVNTVLLVRRRCRGGGNCCHMAAAAASCGDNSNNGADSVGGCSFWGSAPVAGTRSGPAAAGSSGETSGVVVGGGGGAGGGGSCVDAMLAAALPCIDPDGQFFGQRIVVVHDRLRASSARSRPATATARSRPTTALSNTAASRATIGTCVATADVGAPSPVRTLRDLGGLCTSHRPDGSSPLVVVTTADRSLFGALSDHVIECAPYKKEYGKYDDVLDCLATSLVSSPSAVLGTAAAGPAAHGSVPAALQAVGLLHTPLQPSPMMQALLAQMALRGGLRQQVPQNHGPGPGVRSGSLRSGSTAWEAPVAALAATTGSEPLPGAPPAEQQQQQQHQEDGGSSSGGGGAMAVYKPLMSVKALLLQEGSSSAPGGTSSTRGRSSSTSSISCRKKQLSGRSRRAKRLGNSDGGGVPAVAGAGAAASGGSHRVGPQRLSMASGKSMSSLLPPIPELPMLEVPDPHESNSSPLPSPWAAAWAEPDDQSPLGRQQQQHHQRHQARHKPHPLALQQATMAEGSASPRESRGGGVPVPPGAAAVSGRLHSPSGSSPLSACSLSAAAASPASVSGRRTAWGAGVSSPSSSALDAPIACSPDGRRAAMAAAAAPVGQQLASSPSGQATWPSSTTLTPSTPVQVAPAPPPPQTPPSPRSSDSTADLARGSGAPAVSSGASPGPIPGASPAAGSSSRGPSGGVFRGLVAAIGGGVSGRSRDGSDLMQRPRSFPAAAKPAVTRHISGCAKEEGQRDGGAVATAEASGPGLVSPPPPPSPSSSSLSGAASAMATATARLLSRLLGRHRHRRCRPSDCGGAAATAVSSGGGYGAATPPRLIPFASVDIGGSGSSGGGPEVEVTPRYHSEPWAVESLPPGQRREPSRMCILDSSPAAIPVLASSAGPATGTFADVLAAAETVPTAAAAGAVEAPVSPMSYKPAIAVAVAFDPTIPDIVVAPAAARGCSPRTARFSYPASLSPASNSVRESPGVEQEISVEPNGPGVMLLTDAILGPSLAANSIGRLSLAAGSSVRRPRVSAPQLLFIEPRTAALVRAGASGSHCGGGGGGVSPGSPCSPSGYSPRVNVISARAVSEAAIPPDDCAADRESWVCGLGLGRDSQAPGLKAAAAALVMAVAVAEPPSDAAQLVQYVPGTPMGQRSQGQQGVCVAAGAEPVVGATAAAAAAAAAFCGSGSRQEIAAPQSQSGRLESMLVVGDFPGPSGGRK